MTLQDPLSDRELRDELLRRLRPATPGGDTLGMAGGGAWQVPRAALREYIEAPADQRVRSPYDVREAIVRQFARPSLLVRRDSFGQETFSEPESQVWMQRLEASRRSVEEAIRSVGRIDLYGQPGMEWVGTGWVVRDRIVVTNRHVAQVFAYRAGDEIVFRRTIMGSRVRAAIDFRHEHLQEEEEAEFRCTRVLAIAEEDGPDLAFLEIHPTSSLSGSPPGPVPLAEFEPEPERWVAVIGYPAWDGRRNDPVVMERVFGGVYDCKRLAPGMVRSAGGDHFTHDCTTLGGNSGSLVLDLATGRVLGLHFAGSYLQANYAVPARVVAERLAVVAG
jgi:endonuclease G